MPMTVYPKLATATFSIESLGRATLAVNALSFSAMQALADAIHAEQPNLLYAVLVQQRFGATMPQIEVVLDLLLVTYTAMKASGRKWPLITEDLQETCLKRVTGRIWFAEGLAPAQVSAAVQQVIDDHPEPALLSLAFGRLREAGLLGVADEAQRYLVLAALNLVECVSQTADRTRHSDGQALVRTAMQ